MRLVDWTKWKRDLKPGAVFQAREEVDADEVDFPDTLTLARVVQSEKDRIARMALDSVFADWIEQEKREPGSVGRMLSPCGRI